jgi:hypothetical protein
VKSQEALTHLEAANVWTPLNIQISGAQLQLLAQLQLKMMFTSKQFNIRPLKNSFSMHFIIYPISFVFPAISPLVSSNSMNIIVKEIALI